MIAFYIILTGVFADVSSSKKRLKCTAIPSTNLPKTSLATPSPVKLEKWKKREERRKRLESRNCKIALISKLGEQDA